LEQYRLVQMGVQAQSHLMVVQRFHHSAAAAALILVFTM
jgi:hypothetical protein